jgi:hypothetical protein
MQKLIERFTRRFNIIEEHSLNRGLGSRKDDVGKIIIALLWVGFEACRL